MKIPKIRSSSDPSAPAWWKIGPFHVLMRCSEGHGASLRTADGGHEIADDGTVQPSVVCPSTNDDGTACSFHEMVVLEDWTP